MTLSVVGSGQEPNTGEIEYDLVSIERRARAIWMMTAALDDDDPNGGPSNRWRKTWRTASAEKAPRA